MILRAVQSVELLTGGLPTAFNRSIVPAEISVLYAEDSKPAKKASFSLKGTPSLRASFKSASFKSAAAKPSDTRDLAESVRYEDKSPQCVLPTVPAREVFEAYYLPVCRNR